MPDPTAPTADDLAAREAALAERQAKIDAREARLRAMEEAARRQAHADYAETLIGQGRLLPRERDGLLAFMDALPETELAFGEGDGAFKGLSETWLKRFLDGLPVQVDFAERAGPEGKPRPGRFSAPPEHQVDPERLALHAQALAYQEAHQGTSYADAVTIISQQTGA